MYKIIIVLCFVTILNFAQKGQEKIQLQTDVHQLLTRDAFELLIMQYPEIECSEMNNHLGYYFSHQGPWTEGTITTGSYREDEEDIVYSNEGYYTTINHFWRADWGDNSKWQYPVNFGNYHKNAYQKARVLIYGHDIEGHKKILIHGNSLANENVCVQAERDGLIISYNSIFDFFNTGNYYVEGYELNDDYHLLNYRCGPYVLNKTKRDLIIYEILGRVAHLLGDMGVPAHAHNDAHPSSDLYEDDYMDSGTAINFNEYDAINVGGLIDVRSKYDPLRYLFYTTNQVADYFASDDVGGNSTYSSSYVSDTYSELQNINSQLTSILGGPPPAGIIFNSLIAEFSYITSLRAIAGLFLWFANETSQLTAVTKSGSLQNNEIWGNVTLNGNVFVPYGKSLKFCNGTVNLNSYYIKSTGGSIIVESGSIVNGIDAYLKDYNTIKGLYPSISSAISNSTSGYTIELIAKTYNQNLSISNLYNRKFKGSTIGSTIFDGNITITNSNYTTLDHLKMHYGHSITINGGTGTDVDAINFMGSGEVRYYNGNLNDLRGTNMNSASTSPGVYYYNTSGDVGTINISDHDFGVWATANASINVSVHSIFCNNLLDLYANSGGYIYGYNNYMSAPWPQSVAGNVAGYSPYTCSQNLSKASLLANNSEGELISKDIEKLNKKYAELLDKISKENEEKSVTINNIYKTDFEALIADYKILLDENSTEIQIASILSKIEKCYYATEDENVFEIYIESLLENKKYTSLFPYIERYKVNLQIIKNKYKEAIEICEKVLTTKGINETLVCEMLYEEGLLYKYSLEEAKKGNELFFQMLERYPKNNLSTFAEIELEQDGIELPNAKTHNENMLEESVNDFAVENYPNPFNPSTTISYSLPSDANVKVVIYDIMGRIIKTLASETQISGNHQVVWDGTNLNGARVSSGIYLYRFEATSLKDNKHFEKSNKLMLLK
ncbi:MAG: T9SS type A sorting domain-containing protein [Ignavibacteriae bacterium]|nr:T9SS type A sorting domain-containing protein [Ignavibacteriota bacterium]